MPSININVKIVQASFCAMQIWFLVINRWQCAIASLDTFVLASNAISHEYPVSHRPTTILSTLSFARFEKSAEICLKMECTEKRRSKVYFNADATFSMSIRKNIKCDEWYYFDSIVFLALICDMSSPIFSFNQNALTRFDYSHFVVYSLVIRLTSCPTRLKFLINKAAILRQSCTNIWVIQLIIIY